MSQASSPDAEASAAFDASPPDTRGLAPAASAALGRADAWFALGLFAFALLLRAVVVLAFSVEPTWDGAYYHRGALSIAEGNGYSEPGLVGGQPGRIPWSHYPVGYSAFLGAVYADGVPYGRLSAASGSKAPEMTMSATFGA